MSEAARRKGIMLALLSIPAGIIAWDILWSGGFIASVVAFGIAYLSVKLFTRAAGEGPDAQAAKPLIAIILAGVVLSFISGIVMDIDKFYIADTAMGAWQALGTSDFWRVVWVNLTQNGAMWGQYTKDILITLVFAALGSYGIIRRLVDAQRQTVA